MNATETLSAHGSVPAGSGLRRQTNTETWGWYFVTLAIGTWALGVVAGLQTALLVFMLSGLAAAVYGLLYPPVGLFGIGILCTVDTLATGCLLHGGLLRFNTFNYFLLIVILLYSPFLLRLKNRHCVIWQLLLILMAIQLTYSPSVFLGIKQILGALSMFGLLVYFVLNAYDETAWYWMGLINGVIGALGGGIVLFREPWVLDLQANPFALFPCTAMFSVCLVYHLAKKSQLLLLALATINFGWVFLTGSRGGLLLASCCMLFLLLEVRGAHRKAFVWVAFVALICAVFLVSAGRAGRMVDRVALLLDSDISMRNRTSGRSELALGAWDMSQAHPFGIGTGGFEMSWADLALREGNSGYSAGIRRPAHSSWARVLAENGFPGLLLLAVFVMSFAVEGIRSHDRALMRLGLLATAVLSFTFLTHEFVHKASWFVAAGVIVIFNREELVSALASSLGRQPPQASLTSRD